MPAEAMPVQPPAPLPGTVHYRREYRDPLGRALTGTVMVTGTARTEAGGRVILPVAVPVQLIGGALEVDLPPDTYRLDAALRSADGTRITDTDTVTLA